VNSATKLIAAFALVAIGAFTAVLLRPAPTAPEARFATLGGQSLKTSDLRGKVLAVNFWATWCPDCVAEMPKMAETYRKYGPRGYEMIAVAIQDHPNRVADFTQKKALPFKVAIDDTGEISKRFGDIRLTPTTFLIDKKGRVIKRFVGEPQWQEFDRLVEKALAEKG
jgi:peroxiredoxin